MKTFIFWLKFSLFVIVDLAFSLLVIGLFIDDYRELSIGLLISSILIALMFFVGCSKYPFCPELREEEENDE